MTHLPQMSRRCFMHRVMMLSAALAVSSCAGTSGDEPANYYINNVRQIMNEARSILSMMKTVLLENYDNTFANQVVTETQTRYEELLPDLPYIGGDANPLTPNLYQGALALAFYEVMKSYDKPADEAGEILYHAMEMLILSTPMIGQASSNANSENAHEARRREAKRSQRREYPDDWVSEFISGDGQPFDWGVDYTECGICKLFNAYDADEFTPYLCLLDFPISRAMDTGLQRTTTLALGGEHCDFRYTIDGVIQMEWIPPFMKKT